MPITVRQIAERAHVSPSTVSRVLNDYPYVDETTRMAVLSAASELGYSLSSLRRAPRVSRAVLFLVRDDGLLREQGAASAGRPFEQAVLSGLQAVFQQHGVATRMERTRMEPGEAQRYINDVGVAGLVLLGGVLNPDLVRELMAAELPFVVVGAHALPLQADCVVADYLSGMQQAVEHLATGGRRRIGLVNGLAATTSSAEKYRGFRLALALHDLACCPGSAVTADFDAESGYRKTLELLAQQPDLDAIAYAEDQMAFGGLRALRESGRRVPDDVAVTGFYDYEIARFTDPPLTSVHFDIHAMGTIAARRLCMLLEARDDQAWLTLMPTWLVVRASSAARA